ncbi:MAG: tRNA (adenosine(37)-N6)-threonylcarbamoyltransferase complex dimerization subunit type 1 TsaB [Nitrospirae bacterium RBG_16_43_8]|nr:MAG: tRNA (adenosine(37)-N6)-threonylcarbamoyltransferase complex dimerization subunit type 1 TsaB [Nitrospirae bacterium RBG_16_43_8]
MKILAIDTSTMLGGIAIMDESLLIAESRLNVKATHSERLMTEIEHCLKQSGIKISDIDVFAVATGPGSFTGLRIGLSTVKGFYYATGKPIVSVPTLEALAWHFPYSKYPVCTMLDARKKEVYAALFKWEGENLIRLMSETSAKPEEFLHNSLSVTHDNKLVFAGEGAALYRDKIIEAMGEKAIFASPEKTVPSPANVAVLGLKKAKAGEFSEPASLTPMYIRKSEAEVKWSKIR